MRTPPAPGKSHTWNDGEASGRKYTQPRHAATYSSVFRIPGAKEGFGGSIPGGKGGKEPFGSVVGVPANERLRAVVGVPADEGSGPAVGFPADEGSGPVVGFPADERFGPVF